MIDVLINKELTISVPEGVGYRKMDAIELEKYFGLEYNRWGIIDNKRHIIISVCWTVPGSLKPFADAKSVIKGAEATYKKNLRGYTRTEELNTQIASTKAYGVRFEYKTDVSESEMSGEVLAFKYNKKFYVFYYVTKKDSFGQYHGDFDSIIASVKVPQKAAKK